MEVCLIVGFLLIFSIALAIAIYMVGTYRYVTKRMGVKMSFHDFCRLYRHHRRC